MKPALIHEIDRLADWIGADGWMLVRSRRHVIVEFITDTGPVRQTFSLSPSDQRAQLNRRASLRRAMRRNAA